MTRLDITLDSHAPRPLHEQLYAALRQAILDGDLAAGSRLPPSRRLAAELGVARVTVTQAYERLTAEGYTVARTGAGTFVVALPLPAAGGAPFEPRLSDWCRRVLAQATRADHAPGRGEIDFGFGLPFPHIFPYDTWRKLLARYLGTDDAMLARYGSAAGFAPLQRALAAHLARERGVVCTPEQVVIVSGAQQALDLLARLLLAEGDSVLVETPGYQDAFGVFRAHGARLVAQPVDDEGLPVAQIPAGCRARLVFVTPSNQFPRGGTLPLERRLALLQWARAQRAMIIEDDYDGELRYDGRPLPALQSLDRDGRVIYLGTFSKVLFPALRLGYVVLPPALVRPFVEAKALVDRGAPTLTQAAIADFITEGYFERHLRHLRQEYGASHATLAEALHARMGDAVRFVDVPAGLHVMLYLHTADEATFIRRAAEAGVIIYPGRPYHLQTPIPPSILLGFSGLTGAEIEEGVARLARLLT